MVTIYLMNALLITLLVSMGIGAVMSVIKFAQTIRRRLICSYKEKEIKEHILDERFSHFTRELYGLNERQCELKERISKLEEKKKNVKKK